ncbi:glutamate ABC transporter substrate-binding protein [Weissella diestrammenae]|uniref:Glutamate ABC transporter substrate-binding protein n=1 Tax=Weissella diestrammenae TaxID=1162633 RepID=A0A7G9T6H2_9LACO|nr:glutamate ABC transporter substrate-binding protein [Weissella diestrammenae]MCM0583249.1 glutamate ABC transporter substrate-binding protein [Weissella diestrammenae]QNN75697.1 glutamate ABC transporter substrate-binding protein [Weissella diestrammenae]
MKNKIQVMLTILLGLMLFNINQPAVHAAKKDNAVINQIERTHVMRWGTKADTRLMGLMDIRSGKIEGFDVDMAKAITKKVDPKAKAEFTQVTSGTRIPLLKNGNIDAIIATMSINPERAKVVDFSKPYFLAGQSLLVEKRSTIKNIQDVNHKGVTVVGVAGSTSVQVISKMAPKADVLALPDYATALSALKAKQGDVLTTDSGIIAGMAEEDHTLKMVGGTFTNEPYGIAIAKDNPKLVKKINHAIDTLHQDGTYAKLIKKWFGNVPGMDWKEMAK